MIAILALGLSIYVFKKEVLNARKAYLGAIISKPDPNEHYLLEIINKSKNTARNIRIEFPEGNDLFKQSELDSKFPIEMLDPDGSVTLYTNIYHPSGSKHHFKLIWDDDFGKDNEKSFNPTIYWPYPL